MYILQLDISFSGLTNYSIGRITQYFNLIMIPHIDIYISFILYLAFVVGAAYWAYNRTQNVDDYFIGGRSLGSVTTALSAGASGQSGWLLLGLPGFAFIAGFEAIWLIVGLTIGCALNWMYIAKPLREKSAKLQSITLPEFFQDSSAPEQRSVRIVAAIFILVFLTIYTSSGLVVAGKLFNFTLGTSYETGVLIGAITVLAYTLFGGFLAVSMTDVLQSLLMLLAVFLTAVVGYYAVAGTEGLIVRIEELNIHMINPLTDIDGKWLSAVGIISLSAWGLGYFGQPHILARFQAIKDPNMVKKSAYIAVSWNFICMFLGVIIGLVGMIYYHGNTINFDNEQVFLKLVAILFHPLIAGVMLSAVLAAMMSSADSQLLVASSVLTRDLLPKQKKFTEVNLGRITVFVVGIFATAYALFDGSTIIGVVGYAWAGFGAAFGPAMFYTLYSKKPRCNAIMAAIITGSLLVILWKNLHGLGGIFELYELVPGFFGGFLAIWLTTIYNQLQDKKKALL